MKKLALLSLLLCALSSPAYGQIVHFDLLGLAGTGLLPGNEVPAAVQGGTGGELGAGIFLDTNTNVLTVNVGWGSVNGFTDLHSTAAFAHMHGPAPMNANAGVLFSLFAAPFTWNPGPADGFIQGSLDLDALALGTTDLMNGLWYINVHTSLNPAGEIRGNLVATPEPSSLLLFLALGGAGAVFLRLRA